MTEIHAFTPDTDVAGNEILLCDQPVGDGSQFVTRSLTVEQIAAYARIKGSCVRKTQIINAAPASTQNIDISAGRIIEFQANATADFVLNLRFNSTVALNDWLAVGETLTARVRAKMGPTAHYCTGIKIDGVSQTVLWKGAAPTAGNASGRDVYDVEITKTDAATFEVYASLAQWK